MFSPINKQVSSKLQSSHKQKILPPSNNTKSSRKIPQVRVKSAQLHSLRGRGSQVQPVAKTATAPPAVSAPRLSEKFPEKPPVEKLKYYSRLNAKVVPAKEKPFEQSKTKPNSKIVSAQEKPSEPCPRVPRQSLTPRIVAFGSSLPNVTHLPVIPRKSSISGGNDYKVTKSAYKPTASSIFSYDLSPLEMHDYGQCQNPMKSVPPIEVQLLQSGQRSTYLEKRYERSPDAKYNYPEATSMRYGWFHR